MMKKNGKHHDCGCDEIEKSIKKTLDYLNEESEEFVKAGKRLEKESEKF